MTYSKRTARREVGGGLLLALCFAGSLLMSGSLRATTFYFNTDPFAGSTALTTPGRQIVAGEPFISFSPATDVFALDPAIYNNPALYTVGSQISFANAPVASLPTGGVNVVVLQSLDNDSDPTTPFGAGNAASLIATRIQTPGAGFFIYFNSALNLDRLVFSTDLSNPNADLAILARLTNLSGQTGVSALPTFTASNFALMAAPEPSSMTLMGLSAGLFFAWLAFWNRRRKMVN